MQRGFSLVELSIVLVILGLLTGGILAGQSLIRAAELRSVSGDFNRFQTAIRTFQDKYFALPGDMTNATKFWGQASGGCPNGAGTGTQTCDGDGDGVMNSTAGAHYENYRAWQQMANAGLIEGSYSGYQAALTAPGWNIPASRLGNNSGYTLVKFGPQYSGSFCSLLTDPGNMCWPNQNAAVALFFGTNSDTTRSAIVKPEEAWNIDTKMDDGRPDQGTVQSSTGTCADLGAAPYAYKLTDAGVQCALSFTIKR